ncbi:hypothetical protein F2Q68_00007732 [Brassica cretica]|uniref:Uncharacterized protein n=1 Tax=Brassica cretica TaxID=69181 RepID=A0A8S9KQK9_BRACR|nr:hypothetical protein F2Q68_00007732 [Brassica cretica]
MNPATRNLYRAAKPTFRLDGTPQVTIPSQVLSLGPENRREYVIGQFHRCSLPPGGLIHAVVNRLWERSCRIGCPRGVEVDTEQVHVETGSMHEVSNEVRGVETDKEPAQFSAVSDQVVVSFLLQLNHYYGRNSITYYGLQNQSGSRRQFIGLYTHTHDSLSHNHTEQPNVQDDEDGAMSDAMANLNTSRGGRPIKPLQKYQDMDWNTIREKGKRGRRGRGYHTP